MTLQFSSVAQSCPTLCDPMNCSMPSLPVHHQLPEFTQTHIHALFCMFITKAGTSQVQFSSVQSFSRIRLFVIPWIAAHQASLSITNSRSLPKLLSIKSVMPSSYLILLSPSPPAPNPSQHQGLFQWVNSSHEVAKILEFQLQHQSFQWIFRTEY